MELLKGQYFGVPTFGKGDQCDYPDGIGTPAADLANKGEQFDPRWRYFTVTSVIVSPCNNKNLPCEQEHAQLLLDYATKRPAE